jgi:signal transduction histidine kinase
VTGPHLSNGDTPIHPLPSGLIHDLRTPLNAIVGYSEMLIEQTQEQGQDGLLPDLQKILIAGQQLHALINANFHPVRELDSFADLSALREEAATPIETKAAETFSKSAPDGAPIARPTYGFLLVVDAAGMRYDHQQ